MTRFDELMTQGRALTLDDIIDALHDIQDLLPNLNALIAVDELTNRLLR